MKKVVGLYKPIGITPLGVIDAFRNERPEYKNEKIGYAGRLDPMAHGVLLLMIGESTKERTKYLALDKTYEFEVLFGVETDTYDLLGIVTNVSDKQIVKEKVNAFVNKHIGILEQAYPPYSSKAVQGKPLFWWSRENRLHEITIPTRESEISQFAVLSFGHITSEALHTLIMKRIALITGDFRQEEIRKKWQSFFTTKPQSFTTAKFRISCSSGTYVRGLVHELGKTLGTGAVALDIYRTRIGEFTLSKTLQLQSLSNLVNVERVV